MDYNTDGWEDKVDKKMKGGFFDKVGFGTGKSERYEQAVELCKQSANALKLQKKWEEAAKAYLKAAHIETLGKTGDAAEYLIEAANMQRKTNTAESIKTMNKAAELMCAEGKISQAARLKKTAAEIYESEGQYCLAAKTYNEAIEWYQTESEHTSTINQMLIKVAELTMLQEDGDVAEAIKIYEKVADKYLENKLTAPSARDLFFRSCLLHLVIDDTVGASNALERYSDKDPSFTTTREAKLIRNLVKNIEDKNLQEFSDSCYDFNSVMPLDKWKTTILNRIKTTLEKSIKGQFQVV
jgi:alpha-soluble NSF attachment protein